MPVTLVRFALSAAVPVAACALTPAAQANTLSASCSQAYLSGLPLTARFHVYTGRPEPGRHAGHHRLDHLRTRMNCDHPALDRLHEQPEATGNHRLRLQRHEHVRLRRGSLPAPRTRSAPGRQPSPTSRTRCSPTGPQPRPYWASAEPRLRKRIATSRHHGNQAADTLSAPEIVTR